MKRLIALLVMVALPVWAGTSVELGEGSSGGGHVFEDEGVAVTQRANANFTGAGVTVTDSGGKTVVTIPGSGGSAVVVERGDTIVDAATTNIDFLAADFDVSSSPAGESNISVAAAIARDAEVAAAYQPLDSDLTSIAALTTTAFGRGLLDDADGTAARTTIGAVIGTNVQAWDADLDALAGISGLQGDVIYHNGTNWVRLGAGTTGQFLKTNGTGANPAWASAAGGGDALVANPLSQFAATTSAQLLGIMTNPTGTGSLVFGTSPTLITPALGVATATSITAGACTFSTSGLVCTANSTAGQFMELFEDSDLGGGSLKIDLAAVNLTGNVVHTPDTAGKFDPATFLTTKANTRKVSIPVLADASGTLAHFDLRAFFSVHDNVTLVRVTCWSGQANGFTIDVVERGEATPTTGTTGSLTAPLACDSDGAASTSFADSAVDADDLVFVDVTAESLAASEFGGVTVEYTVN